MDDVQDFWAETFSHPAGTYPITKLVLFTGATQSGCGPASSATGPFYCPADQKVYLDLGFFDELKSRFGARGDFAMAYVIAHEFGHHVQTATGVSQAVQDTVAQDGSRSNELSVKQELQADCLAGRVGPLAISELEPGDVEEALTAAAAVGDDRIQERTRAASTRSRGPMARRSAPAWFTTGYQRGQRRGLRHVLGLTERGTGRAHGRALGSSSTDGTGAVQGEERTTWPSPPGPCEHHASRCMCRDRVGSPAGSRSAGWSAWPSPSSASSPCAGRTTAGSCPASTRPGSTCRA